MGESPERISTTLIKGDLGRECGCLGVRYSRGMGSAGVIRPRSARRRRFRTRLIPTPSRSRSAAIGGTPRRSRNLINNDPAPKQEFHRVSAEASQLSVFQRELKAVDAYLAATTPTEVDAVIR